MTQLELFESTERSGAPCLGAPKKLESFLLDHYHCVVGVDEAGRGPLAGPVVACACVLPRAAEFSNLTDSKLLSSRQIEDMYQKIISFPGLYSSLAIVDSETIDRINILQATLQAMREAVSSLAISPDIAIVDGTIDPGLSIYSIQLAKADFYCRCVSAASIIAKFSRDALMREYDLQWPEYGFARHKGYGTRYHMQQLEKYGPCQIHRKSFAPVMKQLGL